MKIKQFIKDIPAMLLGTLIAAVAVYFFLIPSGLAIGSVSGFAIVLNRFIPLSVSTLTFVINLILIALGLVFLGKEFGGKTIFCTLSFSVMLSVFEWALPDQQSLTGETLADMICYIFVVGLAQAIIFNKGGSTGGMDIIAKILNKYLRIDLGKALSIGGMVMAGTAVFAFDLKTVILSLLGTYLNGMVVDHFIFGLNPRKRVCILSQKEEEITRFILDTLHSGASIYEAFGAYTGQKQREIITIVDKNEYRQLMDFIGRCDPAAFITVYPVNEVLYRPKV